MRLLALGAVPSDPLPLVLLAGAVFGLVWQGGQGLGKVLDAQFSPPRPRRRVFPHATTWEERMTSWGIVFGIVAGAATLVLGVT
jgi:hypothetical protein